MTTAIISQATETDSAQAISRLNPLGIAVETERAFPVTAVFTRSNIGSEMAVAYVAGNPFRLRTYDRRKPHARL